MAVFAHFGRNIFFSKTVYWNFFIFCTKTSLGSRKILQFIFLAKIQNELFWPKLTRIWPFLARFTTLKFLSSKILKFLIFYSKNGEKNQTTQHLLFTLEPPYDLALPKTEDFNIFSRNIVSIFQVEIFVFFPIPKLVRF